MTKIIGIAGKKQSGKNTTANIIHGLVLKERGMINDFNVGPNGQLMVETHNSKGDLGWGEFDITRKDNDFLSYAENNMWPYIKMYSFADTLKWICMDLFNVPQEQLFGTNAEKNKKIPHLLWENMPFHINDINDLADTIKDRKSTKDQTPMTAREFMQFFGTNIMRRIYQDVWTNNTIKRIKQEQTEIAIVCDLRFPNEVESILKEEGTVIKLLRSPHKDGHISETALDKKNFDQSKFTHVINNRGKCSIDELLTKIQHIYHTYLIHHKE